MTRKEIDFLLELLETAYDRYGIDTTDTYKEAKEILERERKKLDEHSTER